METSIDSYLASPVMTDNQARVNRSTLTQEQQVCALRADENIIDYLEAITDQNHPDKITVSCNAPIISDNMERFLESLQKIMDNESVRIITIELDLDGTFFYGKIIKITNSLFPTFNSFPPLNITLFQCLMEIKKLASQKNKLFQVNICSTANILKLDKCQRKKIYILLMKLNDSLPILQCKRDGSVQVINSPKEGVYIIERIPQEKIKKVQNFFRSKFGREINFTREVNGKPSLDKPGVIQFNRQLLWLAMALKNTGSACFIEPNIREIQVAILKDCSILNKITYSQDESNSLISIFIDNDPSKIIEVTKNCVDVCTLPVFSHLCCFTQDNEGKWDISRMGVEFNLENKEIRPNSEHPWYKFDVFLQKFGWLKEGNQLYTPNGEEVELGPLLNRLMMCNLKE